LFLVEEPKEIDRRAMQSIWLVGCEMRVPHYRQYDISNYSRIGQHLFAAFYVVVRIAIFTGVAIFFGHIRPGEILCTGVGNLFGGFWNSAGIADLFSL
jgi:hypothetical protein